MTTYIAFLRGINVGGSNRIKMADLKALLESAGFMHPETLIQSGNVLFEANDAEEPLKQNIQNAILGKFGSSISVVLRTADELERLILDCPFSAQEIEAAVKDNTEGESLYVALLAGAPDPVKADLLKRFAGETDMFAIRGRDVYLLLRQSIRNSKLAADVQKLDASVTVRNWNTIGKLQDMAKKRKGAEPL